MISKILGIFKKKATIGEVSAELKPLLASDVAALQQKFNSGLSTNDGVYLNYSGAITAASVAYVALRGYQIAGRQLTNSEVATLCLDIFGHSELGAEAISMCMSGNKLSTDSEIDLAHNAATSQSDFLFASAMRCNESVANMFKEPE